MTGASLWTLASSGRSINRWRPDFPVDGNGHIRTYGKTTSAGRTALALTDLGHPDAAPVDPVGKADLTFRAGRDTQAAALAAFGIDANAPPAL
jgi:hypothetical protein